ncbi:MAG: FAD-dependent oxidoreductase [Bacteroidales bacterium]|nr:FAD-dependent oxidoreductase [Bacteroidales bacterium]
MAPVKLGYSDGTGSVLQKHLDFYSRRSHHIGAIIPEPLYMDAGLRELPTQLGIDHDNKLEGLQKITSVLHDNGSKAIAHLNHPGRMVNPKIPGNYFWSSSANPCENGGAKPSPMNRKMMDPVINMFVQSAQRAVEAGFDMIELQFGHGYLMAQFISPSVNDRKDEYGGDLKNRVRFPVEVAVAVRKAVTIPIIARISADEMIPDGFHLEEMIHFSKLLKVSGIDAIHVTAGSACSTPPWFFQHMFVQKGKTWELAAKIKEQVDLPIIFVGQINQTRDISHLRTNYPTDYIAIGRGMVADPDMIGKFLGEVKGNIRPCLACADGCLGGVKKGKGLGCLVNPRVNTQLGEIQEAETAKNFAVIGGGLAGMEAAITLSKRGHNVDLFEKSELGGQFIYAPLTPKKTSMSTLVPYYIKELHENDIKVIKKEADKTDLIGKYDGLIFANGSTPAKLSIPGLTNYFWADILLRQNLPKNQKVLIIGGGLIGVDIATALIPLNNQVTIVKRTTDFGEDMEMIAKALSLKMLKEKNTFFSDHTNIIKIDGSSVTAEKNGKEVKFEGIDIIVVSAGMQSKKELFSELQNQTQSWLIGDANHVAKAQDAIHDAYKLAISL